MRVLATVVLGLAALPPRDGPLSPARALSSFELEPGYRIELAAAEPLVSSPVAIAFDERGRMYVVENRGYPDPQERSGPAVSPQGTIALLEDTNADGRFDRRHEFAGDLTYPNGIMVWDGGVFVSCAPDLLYLKDTNGDGIADVRRVALTGFDVTKTAQIRFSHPTLGIDNWIYLTSGLNGGNVRVPDRPDRPPVKFTSSDSRFNPLTLQFELVGGQGQYGLTFDNHGRRFTCSNRHPVWHVVMEPRHLARNPHLGFSATVQEVSAVGARAVVWPISTDMTTASFIPGLMSAPHAGTFTAASGVHIHRGDALPAEHRESIFIAESAQNLVQRQVLSQDGVTFTSRPARTGREFLASRDSWFRPVFAANGPDGALYIVDMYRKVIDHPQYVPEASRHLLDFEAGKERGRVYRITARTWRADRRRIDLSLLNVSELVRTLKHRNAWWRETAQRLLVERRDRNAVGALRAAARAEPSDLARIHTLWTLEGLGALTTADVAAALRDGHAAVRENAVRLAEPRVAASDDLLRDVLRLLDDPDIRVRFRAVLAAGEADDPRSVEAIASLARRDGAGRWMRAAILSSIRTRAADFLTAFLAAPASSVAKAAVMQDVGRLFGAAESPERCLALVQEIVVDSDFDWQPAALSGIAEGLRARRFGGDGRSALMTLLDSDSPPARAANAPVEQMLKRTATIAANADADIELRLAAIGLLGHTSYAVAGDTLEHLLSPRQPQEIQTAAVGALAQIPDSAAAASLLDPERWRSFTPSNRETVLSALLTTEGLTLALLDAIEQGRIPAATVGASRRRLLTHTNAAIRTRSATLFASVESGDRKQVYERVRAAVAMRSGKPSNGKSIFLAQCAACHTFDGAGGQLGPDLSGIRNQPVDAILLHTIVPEYEVTPGYEAYVVETRDGRTLVGRLDSETSQSLTLRDASSQPLVVMREHVVAISRSATSLMPNELERAMSEQELADLIAYLKTSRAAR